jgi:hypothetical protein
MADANEVDLQALAVACALRGETHVTLCWQRAPWLPGGGGWYHESHPYQNLNDSLHDPWWARSKGYKLVEVRFERLG